MTVEQLADACAACGAEPDEECRPGCIGLAKWQDEQEAAVAQGQVRAAPARSSVGAWYVTYQLEGRTWSKVAEGKLVLQDHWTLVLDPDTRAVRLAVPNVNVGTVTPA